MNKRAVTIAAAVFLTLFALLALWQIREILVYVLFSLFLGATLRPIAEFGQGKSKTTRVLVYVAAVLVLGAILFLIYRLFGQIGLELNRVTKNIATMETWKAPLWLARLGWVRTLLKLLPPPGQLFEAGTGDGGQTLLPALETTGRSLGAVFSGALVVVFLSLYWMSSKDHFERLWLSMLPSQTRQKARAIWRRVDESLGAYGRFLGGQFMLTWVVISIGSHLLGSPFPVLVGLAVAVSSLVPVVGIPLALVVKFFVGLLGGYTFRPWIMLFVAVVLILMRVFLWPRMYKKRWDSPILSLVLGLALVGTFGLRWALLAPPLAAIIAILWAYLVTRGKREEENKGYELLLQRRAELELALGTLEGDPPPVLKSNLGKLDELLAKSAAILEE